MRDVEKATVKEAAPATAGAIEKPLSAEAQKDKKRLENTVKTVERRISELEAQMAVIEKDMGKTDFYNRADSSKVLGQHAKLKQELESEMEKWEGFTMHLDSL